MKMTNKRTPYIAPSGWEEEPEQLELNLIAYPNSLVLHTNQLPRELARQADVTHIDYPVSRDKNSERVTGSITFENVQEQLPSIDHTDMLVYVGVSRVYDAGYTAFTPQLVWRYATGNKDARVTPKQRELVADRLDKMMTMVLSIDVTAEYIGTYKKADSTEIELSENLLYLRKTTITIQGQKQEGYELLKQPVLDRYSRDLKHIAYFERELLESTGGVEDALLNKYMAERLAGMKSNKNSLASNRILLSRIYQAMDVKEPNKKKRSQIKSKIDDLLASWERKEEIESYKFVKKGRSFHGVDLFFK